MKISKKFIESMSLKQLQEYVHDRTRTDTAKFALKLLIEKGVKQDEK